eukprot:3596437-Amphidinium_carterae.1
MQLKVPWQNILQRELHLVFEAIQAGGIVTSQMTQAGAVAEAKAKLLKVNRHGDHVNQDCWHFRVKWGASGVQTLELLARKGQVDRKWTMGRSQAGYVLGPKVDHERPSSDAGGQW